MYVVGLFRFFATVFWLALFVLLALLIVRAFARRSTKLLASLTIVALIGALVFTVVGAGLVFIEPYEMGVVITVLGRGGLRPEPLPPGLHWIVPFVERVERYPIARQTFTMAKTPTEGEWEGELTVEARTLDGQRIFVDSSVIYEINPRRVIELHIKWQHRYERDLIHPEARGIIRDVVSQYRVDEVVSTKRFEVTAEISRRLEEVLADNGLTLVDFVLRDITFTPEYAQSIEQKQIAEQQALQAKFVVEQKKQEAEQARQIAQGQADAAVIQAKGEAEARLIRARAEAEALKLIAEALAANPNLLTYEYISKLAPGVRVMLVPANTPFILPLPQMEEGVGGQ
ncbi:MAG: SPFH domain-containing protein [Anaerolineae bacterium]|nr:SPFH domain-containing protein [Anaerolineae bacterium]MDW7992719.1 SPFH domain-containing protein [Anaerolineae bacterium]